MKNKSIILLLFVALVLGACSKEVKPVTDEEPVSLEEPAEEELASEDKTDYHDMLKIEISPFLNSQWLDKQKEPLEELLKEYLKMEVQVSLGQDYISTVEALKREDIHLALLSPSQTVLALDQGAKLLLKSQSFLLDEEGDFENYYMDYKKSQLLVASDSPIRSLSDLKGKKVAVANFLSTTGYILPLNLLANAGIDYLEDIDWISVGSHDKAVESVYNGDSDAAFTYKDARTLFQEKPEDIYEKTRVVLESEAVPSDTIMVIASMDEDFIARLMSAFEEMNKEEEAMEVFKKIFQWTGFTQVKDSDFELLRSYMKRHERDDF